LQRTAFPQCLKKNSRISAPEGKFRFLPDSIRDECVYFPFVDHAPHEGQGFVGDRELEVREARSKPRDPQDADRVFFKCVRHVAQDPIFDVFDAAPRIDELAIRVLRDRVDREVAALQVFLDSYLR
jgi:hypothetical protein